MDDHDKVTMGVPVIDTEHREIYEICADFVVAAEAREPSHRLTPIFDRVIDRARSHFRSEEDILDRHGYPTLPTHRAEHERLLAQVENLRARWLEIESEQSRQQLAVDTAAYLLDWLVNHIQVDDRSYQAFLRRLA
ncbi:MAG: bacteriohemerythrin [Magnetospirillum sp.]|nr:bacteriohemerythrin [Magnetospirillum sp.]